LGAADFRPVVDIPPSLKADGIGYGIPDLGKVVGWLKDPVELIEGVDRSHRDHPALRHHGRGLCVPVAGSFNRPPIFLHRIQFQEDVFLGTRGGGSRGCRPPVKVGGPGIGRQREVFTIRPHNHIPLVEGLRVRRFLYFVLCVEVVKEGHY
jgi:hypothetical protein